jgi:hypothetical protein
MSGVLNQGKCGSSIVFANSGMTEAIIKIDHDENVRVSQQAVLDCAGKKKYFQYGCKGGLASYPKFYVEKGWLKNENYPVSY